MLYGVASGQLCAVVSNPPYIAFDEARSLPSAVRDWEPPEALLSGEGGLAATRRLVRKSADVLEEGGLLALEVDSRRASLVAEMVMTSERYRDVQVEPDLSGRERFVVALKER
jgi:release factor glutamine methyltransferase